MNLPAARRKTVSGAFRDGMRTFPGYSSCSPHFDIANIGAGEWQILHVPSGLCKMTLNSLTKARLMCGALSGLPFDWSKPQEWATWQEQNQWLMPWFRAAGMVMYRI